MELFRALAVLAEPPEGPEVARLASLLNLGGPPSAGEYTETFIFRFYPYASVYLGAEGMMGGEARARVADFLAALGETPPPEPDHLSTLLATYARLCAPVGDDNAEEVEDGDGEEDEDARRRERASAARKAFLWEHVLSWMPFYLARVAESAPPFYVRWAELLLSALFEEARECGTPERLPLHLREAPPLADPRAAGAEEFLSSLLAPARSGLIITRDDLARAARTLGTSARAGERRFVLKSLLGQDARGALRCLSREASRQAETHAARLEPLGGVAEWWASRASRAAELLRVLSAEAGEADGVV
jgi:TorA maturation chaperone TorD